MTPPEDFVRKLFQFDPALRIRWGHHLQCWVIERRLDERSRQLFSERPNPYKSPRGLELYEGWKQGYVHVLNVHPTLLDQRVFEHLREADTWRQGGMDKFNRVVDEAIAAEEAAADREQKNWNESASREMHDVIQWRSGNRIAMRAPEPEVVDTGLGFKVVDRRGQFNPA